MNKARHKLMTMLLSLITVVKNAHCIRQTGFILSLTILPLTVQAVSYETYVIETYGGDALLPATRQLLDSSRDGGTVATYQGKLILRTSAANYQAVKQLLSQVDRQPQALTVAVRVGNNGNSQNNIQQGRVIISNRGIQGSGIINQRNSNQQNNSVYQVQTLSGSAASISTNTLYALTQSYQINRYPSYNSPPRQIVIQQQVLLPTIQGIAVTPRLLPNGQVEVQLSQAEEKLVSGHSRYNQNSIVQGQRLNSTIIVPRGQWVTIGQVSQSSQNQYSSDGGNRQTINNNDAPIQLLVQ